MRFLVSRTSTGQWSVDKPPCEDCFAESYDRIEVRTCESEEEYNTRFARIEGKWRSKGANHTKTKDGHIQRTHKNSEAGWFVEINTLEELLDFADKYGEIIISCALFNNSVQSIEIYDDYRE